MATKAKIGLWNVANKVDGYEFNDFVGLCKHDGLWKVVHLRTGKFMNGHHRFKKKADCLAFIEKLIAKGFTFDFADVNEMELKNPDWRELI